LSGNELVTWGGETFNALLAALFARQLPERRFIATPDSVVGPVNLLDVSLTPLRDLARSTEEASDLPLATVSKFANPSRYLNELSPQLATVEKRHSVPRKPFHRWLDRIEGVDLVGSFPVDRTSDGSYAR
jgi:hypothetical protein